MGYEERQFSEEFVELLHLFLGHMGVSLNGGTPKTPQNDHF